MNPWLLANTAAIIFFVFAVGYGVGYWHGYRRALAWSLTRVKLMFGLGDSNA